MGGGASLIFSAFSWVIHGVGGPATSIQILIEGIAGILLLAGLWTPASGSIVAANEVWIVISGQAEPAGILWVHVLLAVFGAAIAMLGPGAWSVDSRLFGRQLYEIDDRSRRR